MDTNVTQPIRPAEPKAKKQRKVKERGDFYIKGWSIFVTPYFLWYLLHAALFLAVGTATNQALFKGTDLLQDGFYVQVMTVKNAGSLLEANWIHVLRYISVSPFLWFEEAGGARSFLQTLVMLVILTPMLFVKVNGKRSYLQVLLMYLCFLLSFRNVMGMLSIGYLFLYVFTDRNKNLFLLLYYGLFSFLSSGIFLNWFLLVPLVYKRSSANVKKYVGAFSIVIGFGFVTAISMKASFFTGDSALDSSKYGDAAEGGAIYSAIARNNLFGALVTKQYDEFVVYTVLLIASIVILVITLIENKLILSYFFFPFLTSFLFEGLGSMAYFFIVFFYFMYRKVIEPRELAPQSPVPMHIQKKLRTGGI